MLTLYHDQQKIKNIIIDVNIKIWYSYIKGGDVNNMKKDNRERFTLRFPTDLYNKIKTVADRQGISSNALIIEILWEWIEQCKRE